MLKKTIIFALFSTSLLTSCKSGNVSKKILTITFVSKSDSKVTGSATFVQRFGRVKLTANLKGLDPGVHAIHIHEKSDCSAADASTAGAHWNPTHKKHGKWGSSQYHRGDIGNFTANANGVGSITFKTRKWCLNCKDNNKSLIGKSLIVQRDADNFKTQPTGNAGAREACAAIVR
jgi:superoxide dismutase, Cu-Zn family